MAVGVNVLPNYVRARNPDEVIRKFAAVQYRRGTYIPSRPILGPDGLWYIWFEEERKTNLKKETEIKDGSPKK